MIEFILVAVIGIGIFLYFAMKKNHSDEVVSLCKPIIDKWVLEKDGQLDTLFLTTYNDPSLSNFPGARIFVGKFERNKGESCGFYIEIIDGIIAADRIFFPHGITSWHSTLAQSAKLNGIKLLDALIIAEKNHHEKFPEWKNHK